MRSIADFHFASFCECSFFYIYIVYLNSLTGSMGICSHVSHVLSFFPISSGLLLFYIWLRIFVFIFITKLLQEQVTILLSFVQFFYAKLPFTMAFTHDPRKWIGSCASITPLYRSPKAPLIASRVSSITSSVCAVERNIASNWEGAR